MTHPSKWQEQAEYFANRLKKRFKHLWKYARRVETNAFRVYHRDIPEIPFAVDWYNNHLHIAEYDRPHDRSAEEHAEWVRLMARTASRALTVPDERVFLKLRERQSGNQQYQQLDKRGYTLEIEENGLVFEANLSDYIDTGLFLDHRDLRLHVARRAEQRRFLNLFCYTGSFSVYAAAAGARSSLSIDLSNTYLEWARRNMELNGVFGKQHEFRRADVLQELAELRRAEAAFDIIVLDPPSFSNSKSMRQTLDIQRDHVGMIQAALALLAPGGELFFSTNKRRFSFDKHQIHDPAGAQIEIRKITKLTMPEDFRDTNIHHVWSIIKKGAATRR